MTSPAAAPSNPPASNPTGTRAAGSPPASGEEAGRQCDFCQDVVQSVRRVALDVEYDRLQKRHQEQYACESCFEEKEQRRLGLIRR